MSYQLRKQRREERGTNTQPIKRPGYLAIESIYRQRLMQGPNAQAPQEGR